MRPPGPDCRIDLEGGKIAIRFNYDPIKVSFIKMMIRNFAAKNAWDGRARVWRLPYRAILECRHLEGFIWSEAALKLAVDTAGPILERAAQEKPLREKILAHGMDLAQPLPDGKILMTHQREAIPWMLQTLRCILADEMGLGKTLTALVCSKLIYQTTKIPTVIVTKASLVRDWQDAARALQHPYFSVHSWASIPDPPLGHKLCLICDEVHYAQNLKTQRTKRMLALAGQSLAVYLLSGTPMKNGKPANLFPLLAAIGHPLAENQSNYEKKYCKAGIQKMQKKESCPHCNGRGLDGKGECKKCDGTGRKILKFYTANGATNLDDLHEQLRPYFLQRFKKNCVDLPEKRIIYHPVEVTEEMQKVYDETFDKAKASYDTRVATKQISEEGEALAILTYIRIAASMAKVQAAIEMAEDIIEQGSKPIIFTEFKASANAIAAHFKIPCYTGDSRGDRSQIVRDFQEGKIPAFCGTREAGGTGLTLTEGDYVIMVDRPLTPGDLDQAIDRAHRIGQHWPVSAYLLQAFDICETIDRLSEKKRKIIAQVMSGTKDTVRGSGSLGAREVLKDLFEHRKNI
jgi:SNF2 family DNA or RNA helicase